MKIDPKALVAPAIALMVMLLVVQQTMSALQGSGAWRQAPKPGATRPLDPYATLDAILARPLAEYPIEHKRDPFGYAAPPTVVVVRTPNTEPRVPPQLPPPVAPPKPVLTSIIFDADPRATIRFNNRDFSIRENSLFAEFRVKSITSSQVILETNDGESLVLTLRSKGE